MKDFVTSTFLYFSNAYQTERINNKNGTVFQ